MLKAIFAWFGISNNKVMAQEILPVELDSGQVIYRISNFQSAYVAPRSIEIYLPPDYDSVKKYRVLYLQDGQNLFDNTVAFENYAMGLHTILKSLEIDDIIIVGIWNTTLRFREYLPSNFYVALTSNNKKFIKKEYGGSALGSLYSQFLIQELIPFIENKFSIDSSRNSRGIGGISMGGLISFYLGLTNPDLFGMVVCLSTHWPLSVIKNKDSIYKDYFNFIEKNIEGLKESKLYFDYGTENLDSWYENPNELLEVLLKERGMYEEDKVVIRKFSGHSHNMRDWQQRIGPAIQFVYSNK
ncbi:MAG: hypothetical protein HOP11_07615 [Saprospiraceae bacterium]|nr:hypothetical protein [Saprospiraceae bacterium]